MSRSNRLASVAVAALLALPAAALAQSQSTQSSPAATPPTATAPGSTASSRAATNTPEQRVEEHIRQLHAQLQITPAEQSQWEQFATVMRENARAMDQDFHQRAQQYSSMNALQDMQSYEQLATAHAQRLQKLVPAFAALYNAMPEQQQKLTDQVFRTNAETRQQRRMQTGRNG